MNNRYEIKKGESSKAKEERETPLQKLGGIEGPRGYHGRPRRKAPHLGEDEIADLPLLLLCDGGGGSTRSLPPRGPHRENESRRPDRLVLGHAIPGSEQGTEGLPREISPPLFAKKRRAYYGRQGSAVGGGARRHRIGGTGGDGAVPVVMWPLKQQRTPLLLCLEERRSGDGIFMMVCGSPFISLFLHNSICQCTLEIRTLAHTPSKSKPQVNSPPSPRAAPSSKIRPSEIDSACRSNRSALFKMGTGRVCGGGTLSRPLSSSSSSPHLSAPPGPPTETASTSVTDTVNGSHHLKIDGYSLLKGMGIGKYTASDTFTVGGYDWAIYFYPDGKSLGDGATYVSLFIALASEGTDVRALFELTLLDQSGKERHKVHSHFGRTLESGPYTLKYRGSMW
ncbi:hypothetical protein B296_00035609 [Ensete ventricosum]|uniref:MATH domain-containing protein n=1 Tax=Ensete ventricosum TaxID=4639 RepID=A0A426ZWK0_ENSVE|nr:hypothetical protein B296_00035609 [Ensete ventricosum]